MMSEREYRYIQDRLRNILRPRPWQGGSYRTDEVYNEGVLACKSVLHEIYERERDWQKRAEQRSAQVGK